MDTAYHNLNFGLQTDAEHTKDQAAKEIETIIRQCTEIINAAASIRAAIKHAEPNVIRECLKTIENHTDGYWHRIVIGEGVSNLREFLADLEEPIAVAEEKAAA